MAEIASASIGDFGRLEPARRLWRLAAVLLVLLPSALLVWPERSADEHAPVIAPPRTGRPISAREARPAPVVPASLTHGVFFGRLPQVAPAVSPVEMAREALIEDLRQSAELAYGRPSPPSAAGDPIFARFDITRLPAGMQNNNPGNLKFVAGQFWPGQLGPSFNTDQGDPQVVFDNAADGMFAAAQLALQRFAWGHDTVRKLIADRRAGWTPGYLAGARGVAAAAGFGLDQRLDLRDPTVLARLLRGIVIQEHGPFGWLYPGALIDSAAARALAEG